MAQHDLSGPPAPRATDLDESALRQLLAGLTAVRDGDFGTRLPQVGDGLMDEIAAVFNGMVDQLSRFTSEVTRVAREVGTDGNLGGQAEVPGVSGTWKDLTESVNAMAGNLTAQVRDIAQVATAVAKGDLSQKITADARGEIRELKNTINTMVDELSSFADEVTRVAREVGTEGRLGGQARVPGVGGTWRDLTDSVNFMAGNLTAQVRSIAQVATAVAEGDLSQKITVDARGEIRELKNTINTMVDQLSSFADEVTRVAREVGTEGKLGGQAEVEGVSGTWKRLTENVNELAGNLTRQVRAIAGVTSAVATGDLTRSISVEAQGEVAELKDNINAMVRTLRDSTRENQEQDWLKTNLAAIAGLMQGHRDLAAVAQLIMDEITPLVGAQYGTFLLAEARGDDTVLRLIAGYGHEPGPTAPAEVPAGRSLVGQAARTKRPILVDEVPAGYLRISSSLGAAEPAGLIVLPIVFEGQVLGVIELASFSRFTQVHRDFLHLLAETVGVNLNTIIANARTDALLTESQRLAEELQARSEELQSQQEELRRSNAELEDKAALLARQNHDIEMKNVEIEQARQEIEERARQLALASKYKSEFLANMSHELRTPLNSLLILARILAQNPTRNLTAKQVEFANVIHSAGTDLLQLINDILDLSKVEAGKMEVHSESIAVARLLEDVETTFRPLTMEKGLAFTIDVGADVPARLRTDEQRLRQILRNLLSNAVKFTERGAVTLRVSRAESAAGTGAVAFSVVDTGIGIEEADLETIFAAFQQADGTASRRYGGTGLGLSISREVAGLLGGEIQVESRAGQGTTFTLVLPLSGPHADGAEGAGADDDPAAVVAGPRRLLVLEAAGGLLEPLARSAAADLSDTHGAVTVTRTADAGEAVEALLNAPHACVVVDIGLAAAGAFLDEAGRHDGLRGVPVLGHAGGRRGAAGERQAHARAGTHRFESLSSLDELRERITLHLSGGRLADAFAYATAGAEPVTGRDAQALGHPELVGRTVLIVDDDVRNVFAISNVLELYGMAVIHAPNGRRGIDALREHPDIDLVLMDIMMPEMDGYATTTAIRAMPRFADLPIIAVTARAMQGDREKSLAAGATDHVTKPVDTEELLACMKRWLSA